MWVRVRVEAFTRNRKSGVIKEVRRSEAKRRFASTEEEKRRATIPSGGTYDIASES